MIENSDLPASPIPITCTPDGSIYNTMEATSGELGGLTKREAFAMAAMQGLISISPEKEDITNLALGGIAVGLADALLSALEE